MEHCRIIAVIIIIMGQFKEVKQEVGAVQGLSAAVLNIRPPRPRLLSAVVLHVAAQRDGF